MLLNILITFFMCNFVLKKIIPKLHHVSVLQWYEALILKCVYMQENVIQQAEQNLYVIVNILNSWLRWM